MHQSAQDSRGSALTLHRLIQTLHRSPSYSFYHTCHRFLHLYTARTSFDTLHDGHRPYQQRRRGFALPFILKSPAQQRLLHDWHRQLDIRFVHIRRPAQGFTKRLCVRLCPISRPRLAVQHPLTPRSHRELLLHQPSYRLARFLLLRLGDEERCQFEHLAKEDLESGLLCRHRVYREESSVDGRPEVGV